MYVYLHYANSHPSGITLINPAEKAKYIRLMRYIGYIYIYENSARS